MKQLPLFGQDSVETVTWSLYVDGASRYNPGPSGAGIYILKNDFLFIKTGYYLGTKTNNQAEYLALILGSFIVLEHKGPHDVVTVISDSQLLVRQLIGMYRVRQTHLYPLYKLASQLIQQMNAAVHHVLRHANKEADAMANYGVDSTVFPPQNYLEQLKKHDITL
jgi:ribonuclease HI